MHYVITCSTRVIILANFSLTVSTLTSKPPNLIPRQISGYMVDGRGYPLPLPAQQINSFDLQNPIAGRRLGCVQNSDEFIITSCAPSGTRLLVVVSVGSVNHTHMYHRLLKVQHAAVTLL